MSKPFLILLVVYLTVATINLLTYPLRTCIRAASGRYLHGTAKRR